MLFYKNVTLVFVSYNHLYFDSRKNEYVIVILFLKLKKTVKTIYINYSFEIKKFTQ